MTLEKSMAYTVNLDKELHVHVLGGIPSVWNKEPTDPDDAHRNFGVGLQPAHCPLSEVKAYKVPDDFMSRDLLQRDDDGWPTHPAVRHPLHSARLQAWPEGSIRRAARIAGDEGEPHAKLLARYQALKEELAEREEFSNKNGVASENFEARSLIFDSNEQSIARAGDCVTVDHRGELSVYPRYV